MPMRLTPQGVRRCEQGGRALEIAMALGHTRRNREALADTAVVAHVLIGLEAILERFHRPRVILMIQGDRSHRNQ